MTYDITLVRVQPGLTLRETLGSPAERVQGRAGAGGPLAGSDCLGEFQGPAGLSMALPTTPAGHNGQHPEQG